jgi:hypothetical protein
LKCEEQNSKCGGKWKKGRKSSELHGSEQK